MPKLRTPLPKIEDYPTYLDRCWNLHLQDKPDNAPTVVSTFAGCGGSSLGYSMAGFRELLAVEWDNNAVETFKLNFPDIPVFHGDIAKLSVEETLERTGLQPGELDIFDGSPPCQGFSMAGKREFTDDRNQLFREYVRLLKGLQPKVLVMENVPGMVQGKMKLVFAEILRDLKDAGYKVSARVLNAMYFGVPQSRQRLIFIGVREDLGVEPSHPKAKWQPVTFMESSINIIKHGAIEYPTGKSKLIVDEMKPGEDGCDAFQRLNKTEVRRWFGMKRLSNDKPAKTVVKSILSGQIHPKENRYLSEGELKRVSSFPDDYFFIGDLKTIWSRIGNSVPPLFMMEIAKHIRTNILDMTGGEPVLVE